MGEQEPERDWRPLLSKGAGPLYLAIADALTADIQSGLLEPGVRLPPQRALAEALQIDFTTVSRAYSEARRRGLIEGRVGQGTYVRTSRSVSDRTGVPSGLIDMGMNLPPQPGDGPLTERLWKEIAGLEGAAGISLLMRYQVAGGAAEDRQAGVDWLANRLPGLTPDRLLVAPGAQGALLALVTMLAEQGRPIAVEELTYPGFRSLAAHLSLPLIPVAMDAEGLIPEALEALCAREHPRLLYCTPTMHNPTMATMSLPRREAVIGIARRYGVTIIEDDAYGMLSGDALPPLAALAPEIVFHVAGLSKCLSPALRVAYVVTPDARSAVRLTGAVRATTGMVSPLGAAVASQWIGTGLAHEHLAAIRTEANARRMIAEDRLGKRRLATRVNGFHAWLPLGNGWTRGEFASRLRAVGVGIVASDAFAVGVAPEAVRIGLGAAPSRETLAFSLDLIADLIGEAPAMSSTIV